MRRAALLSALAVVTASPAAAQRMRDFTATRQQHGESRLAARVEFAAGSLRLLPGAASELYRMRLRYDPERFTPLSKFDPASGAVRLGVDGTGSGGLRVSSRGHLEQSATVALSPTVPLDLDIALGAVDADIELGGLRLAGLRLETGASRSVVRFSRPNALRCASAAVEAGAAEIALIGLGNSRCERITFSGGIGKAVLDLGGTWTADARLDVTMRMGELTLRLPRQVGVRITMERFLTSFPATGWTRRGKTYLSPGYAAARRHVDIALSTTIGDVNVEWLR